MGWSGILYRSGSTKVLEGSTTFCGVLHPERTGCQLARIQAGSTSEQPLPLGKLNSEPPLVTSAAGGGEHPLPFGPPGKRAFRNRLNHQDVGTGVLRLQEPREKSGTSLIIEFVDRIGRKNPVALASANRRAGDAHLT